MTENQAIVQKQIEELLRIAARHKIVVCGFAFAGDPPFITNFGNCNDAHDIKLYERLTETCEQKRSKGQVESISVGEVN